VAEPDHIGERCFGAQELLQCLLPG
jgi:hypothetical protein